MELAQPAMEWLGDGEVIVNVISYNTRAQKFYEKLGFEVMPGSEKQYRDTPMLTVDMIRKGESE